MRLRYKTSVKERVR